MSPTGMVDDVERRGWQRKGAAALVELLDAANLSLLPPLVWQVGTTTGLFGRCIARDPVELRDEFEAWTKFLARWGEVERWPESTAGGGAPRPGAATHLHVARRAWGSLRVDVVVFADVYEGPPGDDEVVTGPAAMAGGAMRVDLDEGNSGPGGAL